MPAKRTKILVADDEQQLLRLVTRNLQLDDYDTIAVSDGEAALEQIRAQAPDVVILDVMMPKLDGFAVCQRVREFSAVPIIIMTARGQDEDKIRGLDLGADDYLTKPFNVDELLARVRSVLRRAQYVANMALGTGLGATISIGDLTIDFAQHLVTVRTTELALTPIEFRLLAYLAQNAGRVLTQDQLLEHIWGEDYSGETHMLQVNVNRLRHKIEPDAARPHYIVTKVGIGYLMPTHVTV